MSDSVAVLSQRVTSLEARVKTLEGADREDSKRYTEILVRLKALETRVGFLAAGIGAVSGVASSVVSTGALLALKHILTGGL